jgi:hypothetical protein
MTNTATSISPAELGLTRSDGVTTMTVATALQGGAITFSLANEVHDEFTALGRYSATLAQTIQLRDFLNRHIDGLALQQDGSLAVRASDAPEQMAGEEVLPEPRPEVRIIRSEPSADLLTLKTHTAYFEVEAEVQEIDGSRRTYTVQFGYAMYHGRGEAHCLEQAKQMALDAGK